MGFPSPKFCKSRLVTFSTNISIHQVTACSLDHWFQRESFDRAELQLSTCYVTLVTESSTQEPCDTYQFPSQHADCGIFSRFLRSDQFHVRSTMYNISCSLNQGNQLSPAYIAVITAWVPIHVCNSREAKSCFDMSLTGTGSSDNAAT